MFLFVLSKICNLVLPQRLLEHLLGHEAHGDPVTNGVWEFCCPVA